METLLCLDTTADIFGVFTLAAAPPLLFYAYVPISALVLFFSLIIVSRDNFSPRSTLLALLSVSFVFFLLNEMVLWTAVPASFIYTSWSLSMLFRVCIYSTLLLFIYVYTQNKYPPVSAQYIGVILIAPIALFLPTSLNVSAVDISECVGINGPLWYYLYSLEGLCLVVVGYLFINSLIRKQTGGQSSQYLLAGSLLLLLFVFGSEFLGEYTGIYEINLVGPVGMLAFIATLSYLIVRYRAFNIKLIGSQALVLSIVALSSSEFFYSSTIENVVVSVVTLLLITVAGFFLVRSVKREVKQREEIQQLAQDLARANERLERLDKQKSEFVSIASHQLRSPLTTMIGYASMLRDGSYGKLPAKALEAATRIEESSRLMATSVEDYLNVSRIEAGHMKYNLTDFSLQEQTEHITDDIRPIALKQNIVLLYRSKLDSKGMVNADKGKTEQILHNLINNAIKYTQKGTITVILHDDVLAKKLILDVIDTGIGMSPETQRSIFQKFERGSNANSTNIHGTGLGLYTAAKLAEAMGGSITAHSDGEGKGSRFTLTLPLLS